MVVGVASGVVEGGKSENLYRGVLVTPRDLSR